jgi:hypothetical protein
MMHLLESVQGQLAEKAVVLDSHKPHWHHNGLKQLAIVNSEAHPIARPTENLL